MADLYLYGRPYEITVIEARGLYGGGGVTHRVNGSYIGVVSRIIIITSAIARRFHRLD